MSRSPEGPLLQEGKNFEAKGEEQGIESDQNQVESEPVHLVGHSVMLTKGAGYRPRKGEDVREVESWGDPEDEKEHFDTNHGKVAWVDDNGIKCVRVAEERVLEELVDRGYTRGKVHVPHISSISTIYEPAKSRETAEVKDKKGKYWKSNKGETRKAREVFEKRDRRIREEAESSESENTS